MTQRILVTGMSGLIGGVVRAELEDDYALSALNRSDVAGVKTWRADLADLVDVCRIDEELHSTPVALRTPYCQMRDLAVL